MYTNKTGANINGMLDINSQSIIPHQQLYDRPVDYLRPHNLTLPTIVESMGPKLH